MLFLCSINNTFFHSCVDKKSPTIVYPEKRRESLPEILRNAQNASDTSGKSKNETHLEDKPKCLMMTKSPQVNYLPQMNNLNLKTVSAESLRSISPGSDSVFYSDPSTKMPSRCTRCNNEVEVDYSNNANNDVVDIVKPPKGFGDSPEEPPTTPIMRTTKRYRSEERRRNVRSEPIRAKSEERVKNYRERGP